MRNTDIVSAFTKATASQGGEQNCVEVAHTADGGRAVRDSKDPRRGTQFHAPGEWGTFLRGVKAGAFGG